MRKGFTLVETLIAVVIGCILGLVVYGNINRIAVDQKCTRNGYVSASRNGYNKFCTKVQNGNTIVVHVDSLR